MQSFAVAATARPSTRHFLLSSRPRLASLALPPFVTPPPSRCASHASQGVANRARRGPGKRLGLKKGATEPVVPGNIIFRQRGSQWHAGENCVRGRDHTISALESGFVRYYRDPARHPTRKYIGVVFNQDETLPRPLGSPRRRRLGLVAVPMQPEEPPRKKLQHIGNQNAAQTDGASPPNVQLGAQTDAAGNAMDVMPLIRDWSGRPPNWVLGHRAFARIMAKHKGERRRHKRLQRLRSRSNKRQSSGLGALTARQGAGAKTKKRRGSNLFRRWKRV